MASWVSRKEGSGQPALNRSKQAGMATKTIIVLLVGLALTSVHLAEAQQQKKVARIAYLGMGSSLNPGPEPGPDALVRLGALRTWTRYSR
jgi:hypothetical protein